MVSRDSIHTTSPSMLRALAQHCMGAFLATCFVALAAAVATNGCAGDACSDGESKCDGDQILSCGSPGDISGRKDFTEVSPGCGSDQCLDIGFGGRRAAACSTTGQPDPRCTGKNGEICADDRTKIVCQYGYSSSQVTCPTTCIRPANATSDGTIGAYCALEGGCVGDAGGCDGGDAGP
jgi:hypothetical protein